MYFEKKVSPTVNITNISIQTAEVNDKSINIIEKLSKDNIEKSPDGYRWRKYGTKLVKGEKKALL